MRTLPPLRLLLFSLCLGVGLAFSSGLDVKAQTCTAENAPPVDRAGWIKASNVQVYIDPAIQEPRRAAVVQAFTNWNAASGTDGNNSRVTYTIVNSPPPAGSAGFTVNHRAPTVNLGVRAETTTFMDASGYTTSASTSLDPLVIDPAAVLEVMAHEIGHPRWSW